jgi:hypothetical protein
MQQRAPDGTEVPEMPGMRGGAHAHLSENFQ